MGKKKAFFNERTPAQIRKLDVSEAWRQRGLVDKILNLGPEQGLVIRTRLIPGRFYEGARISAEAARKLYKHGNHIVLSQPGTIEEALETTQFPHEIRRDNFDRTFKGKNEEDIQTVGYSFRPIQGRDKRKRLVPLAWIFEGARIFAYADRTPEGIKVTPYGDAQRVAEEGATVMTTVPSREDKKSRYTIQLSGIPIIDNPRRNSIAWSFNTSYAEGRAPEHALWSIRYVYKGDQEQSNVVIMYPHDIAAELGVTRHFLLDRENTIPWNMNPFAKPSKLATDFYRTLCNNVLIADPDVRGKDKTRKLYVPEKSLLIARLVGTQGHDATMFWQAGRDPKLASYDWSIPKSK